MLCIRAQLYMLRKDSCQDTTLEYDRLSALLFPSNGRVPHISLVFREMWETTPLSLWLSIHPMHLAVNLAGCNLRSRLKPNLDHKHLRPG
jgi:hypothetical protein